MFYYDLVTYAQTIIVVLFLSMYLGKFFCFSFFEKIYDDIKNSGDEGFLDALIITSIFMTLIVWILRLSGAEVLLPLGVVLISIALLIGVVLMMVYVVYCSVGIMQYFKNLHYKIRERKYGHK